MYLRSKVTSDLEINATLQQQHREAEVLCNYQ